MKILFVGHSLKFGGGMSRALSSLIRVWNEDYEDEITIAIMGVRSSNEEIIPDNCNIYALGIIRNSTNRLDAIVHNLQINKAFFSVVKEVDPDVIVSFIPDIATVCKIRFPSRKVIGCLRVNPNVYIRGNVKHLMLTKLLAPILDGFVFQTFGARKTYSKQTQRKSIVIPNGTQIPQYRVDPASIHVKTDIYSSGRLAGGKRFDDIIKSFAIGTKNHQEYRLVILGDGENKEYLMRVAKEFGVYNRVLFGGEIRNPMKEMANGYMYLFASDSEGYPNALAEAMAIGLPCVATNCDYGPSEMIEDGKNGFLVDVGDIEGMAEMIKKLIEDPDLAKRISLSTSLYRSAHEEHSIGDKYHQYIEDIVYGKHFG